MDQSWIESANRHPDYSIQNLPFCIFSNHEKSNRIGIRVGDSIVDLYELAERQLLPFQNALKRSKLNGIMKLSPTERGDLRNGLLELLIDQPGKLRDNQDLQAAVILDTDVFYHLPVDVGNYSDFYASITHATNVGCMFRPESPLLENYRHLPVGYHGRASSVVVSGTTVRRPAGQLPPEMANDHPQFGPTRKLDYELELGIWIGPGNEMGETISISDAPEHFFGCSLLNDWSARDIQRWEYQPLGPFLGKSFATSVSPYIVTGEALAPFRCRPPERTESDPELLPYLDCQENQANGALDLTMEVYLQTEKMRTADEPPWKVSHGNYREMYWTVSQMIAHHTSNGCNLQAGDLLGSGTVSGRERMERGCLLERNWEGDFEHPVPGSKRIELELPNGERRDFLEDGDEVIMTAFAEAGESRIGLGECRGRVSGG